MFKKNPNRPPITINLKKVNSGYRVIPNESFNPFSFKKITRAIFKNQLQNSKGPEAMISGVMPNSALIQPPSHITIPLSASWFDYDSIHDIEKQAFPQFFLQEDQQGKLFKKTPKLYRFYRNFMITLWRQNSKKYLSPSVCRKNLPGDVSALIRLHSFLQHWGLINFPSKQHSKGYVQSKPYEYCCHICQEINASTYYLCKVDDQTIFHICNCCYKAQIYPSVLKQCPFYKVTTHSHEQAKKRRMNAQQINKMLQIINSDQARQKDLWTALSQHFPQYTKQQILINFLQIPHHHRMNVNIFSNHQDLLQQQQPPLTQQPTIFEDYENQQQLQIAISYFLWKTEPQKYSQISHLFEVAEKHAKYLSQIQRQKCIEMIRMLIDVQQSKLELKSMFIQQFDKLTKAEVQSFKNVTMNLLAEEIKNQYNDI